MAKGLFGVLKSVDAFGKVRIELEFSLRFGMSSSNSRQRKMSRSKLALVLFVSPDIWKRVVEETEAASCSNIDRGCHYTFSHYDGVDGLP